MANFRLESLAFFLSAIPDSEDLGNPSRFIGDCCVESLTDRSLDFEFWLVAECWTLVRFFISSTTALWLIKDPFFSIRYFCAAT